MLEEIDNLGSRRDSVSKQKGEETIKQDISVSTIHICTDDTHTPWDSGKFGRFAKCFIYKYWVNFRGGLELLPFSRGENRDLEDSCSWWRSHWLNCRQERRLNFLECVWASTYLRSQASCHLDWFVAWALHMFTIWWHWITWGHLPGQSKPAGELKKPGNSPEVK